MKHALVVGILAAGLFAGCLGGGTPSSATQSSDAASNVLVEPEPGVQVSQNRGVVRGTVYNDASLPLGGARVSLLQTDFFTSTAKDGKFLIPNVTVGQHFVRVESTGFQAYENQTEVTAGAVTNLTIYLVPDQTTGAGYRPHVHDFWGDKTELFILDDDIDVLHPPKYTGIGGPYYYQANAMVYYPNSNSDNGDFLIPIPSDASAPKLVYPGTKQIQVTITWTQTDSTVGKVRLKYATAADSKRVALDRHASGASWTIDVTPDQTDAGHQESTLWSFFMNPAQDPTGDGTAWKPGLILGKFHVAIKVFKGVVPPEPAHPNFWGTSDTILIRDHDGPIKLCDSAYRIIERSTNPCMMESREYIPKIIPPGTKTLHVEFKWTYAQADGTAPASDLTLLWRTAGQSRWATALKDFHTGDVKTTGTQTRSVDIDVKPGDNDAFYQKYTFWAFTYAVKGHEKDTDVDYEPRTIKWTLKIVAEKDPSFDAGI